MTQLTIGTRVVVTASNGGMFYSGNKGKHGTVTRVNRDSEVVHVRFDDGIQDYGRFNDVELLDPRSIQVGSKVIVTAEEGGVFLRKHAGKTGDVYHVDGDTVYVQFEDGGRDYGRKTDVKLVDLPTSVVARRITHAEMKEGMKVRFLGADTRGHEHWNFVVGQVYSCGNGGPISIRGTLASNNWGDWKWELVEQAVTLDEHLAELRAQLDEIKAEKTQAEAEVAAAQAKVDGIEARRVVLVGSLTKHGIQFIGEAVPARTAQEAFDADELEEGMTLLCVTPYDTDEHTAGKQYKIVGRDVGDEAEFRLESDDGYGYWLDNDGLVGYTVVA